MLKITTLLSILICIIFFSCERGFENPYDRDCPTEIWTPENLVADTSANGVLVTWIQSEKHFDGFQIDQSADSSNWRNISTKTIDKETREFTDTTVSAGDTLYYRIYAIADKNASNYCYSNRVVIPASLSSVITNDVTDITSTAATFNGNIISDGVATVTERGFCYATTAMPDITKIKVTSGSGIGSFTKAITGLTGGTIYYMRAYAISDIGISYGEQVEFRTSKDLGYCGCDGSRFGSFTDSRDGHVYKIIQIGDQVWMAENLAYLPSVNKISEYSNSESKHYVYDYDGTSVNTAKATTNYKTYGVLYNWPAALNSCPAGWHLPSDAEWSTLSNYLTNNGYGFGGSGDDIAKSLASTTGWKSYSAGGPGDDPARNNSSCFSALPSGFCFPGDGLPDQDVFFGVGFTCDWWSSTAVSENQTWNCRLNFGDPKLEMGGWGFARFGSSIRCLKD